MNLSSNLIKIAKDPFIVVEYTFSKGMFQFLPDKPFIQLKYRCKTGKKLDLNHPVTFNEKLQWLKLYDRNPLYIKLVDKFGVRDYIQKTVGEEFLIPLIEKYNSPNEIKFKNLPQEFVLKTTHDSGGVFIVNQEIHKEDDIRNFLEERLKTDYYKISREWPYKSCRRMIIAEKLLTDESGFELKDYKLFCFNGRVELIQVDFDRFHNHRRNLYTNDWEYIDESIEYPNDKNMIVQKPAVLEKMIRTASQLSRGIPHVRVDMYVIREKIYIGELTFYHGSGYETFSSEEMEQKLGGYIEQKLAYKNRSMEKL